MTDQPPPLKPRSVPGTGNPVTPAGPAPAPDAARQHPPGGAPEAAPRPQAQPRAEGPTLAEGPSSALAPLDEGLEHLFAAARAVAVHPSEALVARVLADAAALQPATRHGVFRPAPSPAPSPAASPVPAAWPVPAANASVGRPAPWRRLWARGAPRLRLAAGRADAGLVQVAAVGALGLVAGLSLGVAAPDLAAPLVPGWEVSAEIFPGDGDIVAAFALFEEG